MKEFIPLPSIEASLDSFETSRRHYFHLLDQKADLQEQLMMVDDGLSVAEADMKSAEVNLHTIWKHLALRVGGQ